MRTIMFSRPDHLLFSLLLFLSSYLTAMALEIAATNDRPSGNREFDLSIETEMSDRTYQMDYLTDQSGQLVSQASLANVRLSC